MIKEHISILMPVKNVEEYIRDSIDSVLNQTYLEYELIILDDSDDKTSEIVNSYSDERIKHIRFSGNISRKLNYGLQIAKYEYICRMDGDDIIDYKKIEKQINFLKENPVIDVIGTNYFCINESGDVLYEKKLPEFHQEIEFMMPVITSVLHSTIMLKKSKFLQITPYDETLTYAEDLDLFLKSLNKIQFYNLQEPLYYYRIFDNRINVQNDKTSYLLGLKYLDEKLKADSNDFKTMYQIGLLEYYRNDISKARSIFFKLLFGSGLKKYKIIRYIIPALLGNSLVKLLRSNGILRKMNSLFLKYFNYDTYSIRLK